MRSTTSCSSEPADPTPQLSTQVAAGYLDCALWAEALAADTTRVLALLVQRTLSASELRRFAADLQESSAKLRLHVAHAETALQRAKRSDRG